MELTQLTFAVDTTPLDTADKKIRGLGEALKTLERPMSAIAKDSSTVASGVEEVASKAQAAGSKLKGVEASLEKVSTAMKIFRGETVDVGDEVVNLGSSFTKSQANFLALQKQLGASADQLKSFAKEFNDFNKITSANTFDNSIAGVQRLTKDIRELSEVNKLAAANTTLTRDQVMNLVRDTERLQQAMQSMGKSNDEINASIAQQTQQYVNLANEKNKLIAQTKAMEDSARAAASAELERAKASAYVTKEAEKLAFVNAQLKEGFTVGSANALYKYKEALDLTAMSADQAKAKLAAFGEQLKSKQSSSPFAALVKDAEETRKQVNHLARDVSVQLGDIAISLAGGQNPFMVLIQQGDQIRGALLRAKDQGVDTSQAMKNALGQIATSFVDLGKMVGTFFVGSIQSAGGAVTGLITNYTLLGASIENYKRSLASEGEAAFSAIGRINKLGEVITFVAGTVLVGAIAGLAGLTIGIVQSIREHDQLVKTMVLYGSSLNMSYSETMQYAESLRTLGFTAGQATDFISTFAKAASFSAEEMRQIAPVALEAQKYLGISFEESAKLYEKLKEKPTEGLIEIAKKSGLIPPEIIKIIDEYEKLGQKDKAVSLAIQESLKNTTEQVEKAKENYSGLAMFVMNAGSAVSKFFDTIFKSVWTKASGVDRIKDEIADLDQSIAELSFGGGEAAKPLIAQKKALEDQLHAMLDLENQQKINNQRNQEGVQIFDAARKEIQGMRKDAEKLDAKEMSQSTFIAKSIEQRAKAIGKTVDQLKSAANYSELMSTWTTKFAKDWSDAQKKTPKGSKPKETFSVDLTNEVEESKKAYDRQLKIAKDYESSRRDILKNSYEARMISLGDYVGQEIKLSIQARDNQLEIARQGNEKYNALMQKNRKAIEDAAQSAIDKGGSVSAIQEKEKKDLEDLDRKVKGVNEAYLAQVEALDAATDKRFSDFYKELAKSAIESEKSLTDFTATVQNNANARKEEIDLQLRLIGAHGAEAEAIKASSAAMKSYAPEIAKQTKLLADQEKVLRDLNEQMKDATPEEAERLDVLGMQALENTAKIRKNLDRTVAQQRQDSEQAATDASIKYQIEKYNELKGTLSDSIYTAIFEGGKKGGDILKNYLMKEFKNFVIKVFIEPIVGNLLGSLSSAIGVSGAGGAGGSTSGGIGGATSIVSTAANLYKGGLSFLSGEAMKTAATQAISELGTRIGGEIGANLVMDSEFFGNIAGAVGNAFAGYGISKLIGHGYKTGLGNAVDIAGAIGSYFFGPISGVVSGLVNRAFGRKLKDVGIEGTFSNTGFEGQNYQFYKGGWLRSDKTTYSEMDQTMENLLSYQFKQLQFSTAALATSIGASVDSIKDFTKKIKVSFKGLDEKQINEKLTEVYDEISNEMAAGVLRSLVKSSEPAKFEGLDIKENILGIEFTKLAQVEAAVAVWNKSIETGFDAAGNKLSEGWIRQLGDAVNQANDILDTQTEKLIESYQWFGETFSETLKRLSSSITTVNESFKDLGYTLVDVSLQGASKASDIISLFGGEDQYIQATGYFYDKAYTQEEKAANLTNRLSEALGRVNVELPESISGYRELVDAYAEQGDAGREVWASLVQLFPAFEQLVNLNEEIEKSIENVDQAYARLKTTSKTSEDIARERISLEERLFNAVATTAEIAEKARNAIDPMNRALYDAVLVAEATKAEVEAERKARVDGLKAEREAQAKLAEMSRQAVNTLSEGFAKLNAEATKTQRISAVTGLTAAEQAQNAALVDFIDAAYETQAELTKAGADTTETAAIITKALSQLSKSVESARLLAGDFAGAMAMAMEDAKRTSADLSRAFTSESEGSRRVILEESLKISREFSAYLSENALRVTDFAQVFGQAVGGAQGAAAQLAGMDYQEFADRFSDEVVAAVGPAVSAALSRGAAVGALPQNAQGVAAIRYVSQVQAQNTPSALASQAQTELTAFKNLESAMQKGSITAEEFADAVAILRSTTKTAGDAVEEWSANLQKFVDAYAATGGAGMETAEDLGARAWLLFDTAAGSAEFYFRQMGDAVKEFNAEASKADDSIDAITGFVGRMKSAAAVFGESAQAMVDSAAGNPYKNYRTGSGTEFDATLYNSQAVSSAADTLAGVITTRTAAAMTNAIADLPSFDTGAVNAFKEQYSKLTAAIGTALPFAATATGTNKLLSSANALVTFVKSADFGDARIEGLLEANTDKWAGGVAGINQLVYDLDAVVNSISSTGASAKDVALLMQDIGEFDNAGLEKTFYRLSDALNTGKISAEQYSELIKLSSEIYLGTADVTKGAVETIEEAYNRLKNVTRTNEDIAREKISLEERLFAATATTAQIATKARNAIDAHNQSLYDEVIAAEAAKALNQTKKEVESEMFQADIRLAQALGNKTEADRLQREAFIAGLGDLTEAQKAAKIAAYDYSKAIDNQIEAFDLLKGINAQIEELQASSGPLDTIKTGIQAYITKLKELGQLTPDAQTAIDNLSELQLGQGRKNLYDQLLSPEEKSEREASDLSASFARLGVQMPTTTAAFRALIDATTDPTLKDSLLDLVPAFVSVQSATAQVTETIEQAYSRLKNVTRTNEDIAREKISLEERLFNATATAAQIAEKARNAIDPLNQALYDTVIAAEEAKAANERIANEKTSLEERLFAATATEAQIAEKARNAIDALNVALYDQVLAAESAKAANERIAEERKTLDERLFAATATEAQIAEKARNAIDQMNRSLYDTVIAAETLKETNRILKESSSDKQNADLRLLQAQGKTVEAEALQRNIFIAGLEDLTEVLKEAKIVAYDYSASIDKQISAYQISKQFMQDIQGLVIGADIRLAQSKGDTKEVERLQQEQFESGLSKDYSPSQREALIAGYKYSQMIDKKIIADKEILDNTRARAEANIKLLTAEGKSEEAATAARSLYKSSLVDLTDAQIEARMVVYDYGVEIDKKIEALQKLKTIEQERLGLENTLLGLLGYTNILRQRELENLDESNRSLQQHIWLVEDSRTATDKALESVKQLGEAQISELQKSFDTTDAALSKVQRSIDAQKEEINKRLEAAQEAESNMTAIFELLSSAISDLLGQVKDDTGSIQYRQARDIISSALSTGTLPSQDVLSTAVGSATAGLSDLSFATKVERDRAYLGLSNELEGLKKIAEPQMTSSQQQVKLLQDQLLALDNQAKIAQDIVNSVRGVDTSVTTVDSAIEDLRRSAASEESARDQIKAIEKQIQTAQLQYDVLRNIDTGVKSLEQALLAFAGAVNAERAAAAAAASAVASSASASSAVGFRSQYDAGPQAIRVYGSSANGIILDVGTDWSAERVANQIKSNIASFTRTGNTAAVAELEAYAKSKGIPAFADGGYYQGDLALVGEEGPELINFSSPGMVYTAAQSANLMQGDNSELVAELQALREEVVMLRAETRATAVNTSKTARILDDVTQGGDSLKTTTA